MYIENVVLISDPITHSVQDTHPNEWLLTEYISDIRPSVEGQLIDKSHKQLHSGISFPYIGRFNALNVIYRLTSV